MNKQTLINRVAEEADLSKAQAKIVVETFASTVTKVLSEGDIVSLPGFGTFSLSYHPEKQGRNPQTGESITIAGANKVSFKPGTKLKQALL
jgi:nucleoid DNA-binding protein